ncbi:MAG: hypothetical protein K0R29_997 [Pseudobdellovibrio sp.]|jgi:hypothetical protein|nr:hypothetical protein [Pseudobdellovibrio sp.]
MKIVFAGLFSLLFCVSFFGCAHLAAPSREDFEIKFKNIASDSRLKKIKDNQYQITFDDASLIKVIKYKFENQNDLQTYVANRRANLNQDFENNMAPAAGQAASENSCASRVNIKGEVKPVPGGEYFFLEFPVTSERVVSACSGNDEWGMMTYHFYSCIAGNELYEVRYSRQRTADQFDIKGICE